MIIKLIPKETERMSIWLVRLEVKLDSVSHSLRIALDPRPSSKAWSLNGRHKDILLCRHTMLAYPGSLQQHKKYWLLNSDIIIFPPPLKVQKMINLNQYWLSSFLFPFQMLSSRNLLNNNTFF